MSIPGVPGIDAALLTQVNGIDVSDEDAREWFSFGLGSTSRSKAERRIRCDWRNRLLLAAYLSGGSTTVAGTPFLAAGQPYPDDVNLLCCDVETEGDGTKSIGPNGMVAYQRAMLKATYKPPEFDFGNAALLGTVEIDFSSSAVAIDQGQPSFKWFSDNTPLAPSNVPALRTTSACFTLTAFNRPAIPYSTIMSLIDCVNGSVFSGFPAGQIIFRGGRSTRKIVTGAGSWNWDIRYVFEACSAIRGSWNRLYRPNATPAWQTFVNLNDGSLFWPAADLNALFI